MRSRFGFSRLADRNISRINRYPGRVCLFAFQEWTSYVIVVVMVSLGIMMRRSPFPKPYLGSMYTGIGGALFLASWHYHLHLLGLHGMRERADR